ncbi:hypothetical protein FH609_002530 [Streptomyces sp. 3MP-14]|uniref:Uncharacterized protein n=1 Tax=Streptomyces mimosae TaxID=2586635 RepID=A0A5N6AF12_9ACTN|nr:MULTISPECIES: hypothetical protein [Streptomyces]KAB8166439.1 hypothetical protein FH607_011480 [Streptomyces mimosae]KAB8178868.1 hypothetical protein FH609_002530 [Streptomyces sp. 3MP-14]
MILPQVLNPDPHPEIHQRRSLLEYGSKKRSIVEAEKNFPSMLRTARFVCLPSATFDAMLYLNTGP